MSTRATYLFEAGDIAPATCFYIHSDGYREGAAYYFRQMLNHRNPKGGMACMFVRANANAELTAGHRAHGDTEYRYTVHRDGGLTVSERINWAAEEAGWSDTRFDSVAAFVNAYSSADEPKFFLLNEGWGTGKWYELPAAVERVEQLRREAVIYAQRFGRCGNTDMSFSAFTKAAECLLGFREAVIGEQVATRLRLQLHTLADVCASVEHSAKGYYGMQLDELAALVAERGLQVQQRGMFGNELYGYVQALTAADYASELGLETVRVTVQHAAGWPAHEYDVPVGCDVLAWLNRNETAPDRMVTASMVRIPDHE